MTAPTQSRALYGKTHLKLKDVILNYCQEKFQKKGVAEGI